MLPSGAISRLYIANANRHDSGNYSCGKLLRLINFNYIYTSLFFLLIIVRSQIFVHKKEEEENRKKNKNEENKLFPFSLIRFSSYFSIRRHRTGDGDGSCFNR
jgi:hypothetical protein